MLPCRVAPHSARYRPDRDTDLNPSLHDVTSFRKLLVIQHWGIGDLLMTTPLLHALHRQLPEAVLDVIVGFTGAAEVLRDTNYVDVRGIIRRQGSQPWTVLRFFASLRTSDYDAAIVATRISPRMGQLARVIAGIPIVAGDGIGSRPAGYTHYRQVDLNQHRVEANLAIGRLLCDLPETAPPRLDVPDVDHRRAQQRWAALGLGDSPVLAIHPGSGLDASAERRLPRDLLQTVIDSHLGRSPDNRVLIVLGPAEQNLRPLYQDRDPRVRVISDASLHETAALLARCRALLAGDTGVGHIAAAMGTPVITVAGPTLAETTRPWGKANRLIRTAEALPCMPCYDTPLYGHCPYGVRCLSSIRPEDVLQMISSTIESGTGPVRAD